MGSSSHSHLSICPQRHCSIHVINCLVYTYGAFATTRRNTSCFLFLPLWTTFTLCFSSTTGTVLCEVWIVHGKHFLWCRSLLSSAVVRYLIQVILRRFQTDRSFTGWPVLLPIKCTHRRLSKLVLVIFVLAYGVSQSGCRLPVVLLGLVAYSWMIFRRRWFYYREETADGRKDLADELRYALAQLIGGCFVRYDPIVNWQLCDVRRGCHGERYCSYQITEACGHASSKSVSILPISCGHASSKSVSILGIWQ